MEAKPAMTHNIIQAARTLRDRRLEKRVLEESKKKQEQTEGYIEESKMHELLTTSPSKTISDRWREQQRLLDAKHHKTQKQSSDPTASLCNVSTSYTSRIYSTTLPTIYASLQATTPSSKTENYKPPSLVMEWIEQELAELNLSTYPSAPAAASQTDEHENENENETDEEDLPIDSSARRQALEKMRLKLHRRREREEDREDKDEEEEDEDEGEDDEEEDSLTFAAFDRKLRMKAAVWEIQRREKRSSDSTADHNTEIDRTELRFGPAKAGMRAVMEERTRRKRERAAAKEASDEAGIKERTFNTSNALSFKDPEPIRGMQMVMEERVRRRRAKAAAEESSIAHNKQSSSDHPSLEFLQMH